MVADTAQPERPDGPRARLSRLAWQRCIPITASIELTLRCNIRCVHCYNFDRSVPYRKEQAAEELSDDEIFDLIDQLADAGCLYLGLTGGEALLHPRLLDFVRHARRRRFVVRVKTNGVLLTAKKVDELVAAGANAIDVSLYGGTAATHDAFTRSPGSFERTVDGIRRARDAGLNVTVNVCVVRSNAHEVETMLAFAGELGVRCGVNPFITARYDGTDDSLDESLDPATLDRLYRGPLRHLLGEPDHDPRRSVQCGCARTNCGISATGEVYPCIGAPVPSGNVRERGFRDIWKDSPQLNRIRRLRLEDFTACAPCPDRPYCGRNSGVAYTNTGVYTGPEPFTCMDAAVRRDVHEGRPFTAEANGNVGHRAAGRSGRPASHSRPVQLRVTLDTPE